MPRQPTTAPQVTALKNRPPFLSGSRFADVPGFAPAEEWRLVTAHRNRRLSDPADLGDQLAGWIFIVMKIHPASWSTSISTESAETAILIQCASCHACR